MPRPRRWQRGCIRWSGRLSSHRCCGDWPRAARAAPTAALPSCAGSPSPPLRARSSPSSCCRHCSRTRCRCRQGRPRRSRRADTGRRLVGLAGHAVDRRRRRVPGAGRLRRAGRLAHDAGSADRCAGRRPHVRPRRGDRPHVEQPSDYRYALAAFRPAAAARGCRGHRSIASRVGTPPTVTRRAFALLAVAFPFGLLAQSPLVPLLRHPNSQTQHLVHYIDFRPDANPYVPQFAAMPLSPFWATLADRPRGSRVGGTVLFESYDWDTPRWERLSGQTVIPGYLTGLCVQRRGGELPRDPRYRFATPCTLPTPPTGCEGNRLRRVAETLPAQCRRPHRVDRCRYRSVRNVVRERFGTPTYEDSHIIVFPVPHPHTATAHAPR